MNSIFLRGGPFLEAVFHSTFKLCSSFRTGLFLRGGAHHASGGQRGYRPSGFPVRGASRPPNPGETGNAESFPRNRRKKRQAVSSAPEKRFFVSFAPPCGQGFNPDETHYGTVTHRTLCGQGFDKVKRLGERRDGSLGEGRGPLSSERGPLPSPGLLPRYSCAKKRGPTLVTLPAPMVRKISPGLRMPGNAATISSKF